MSNTYRRPLGQVSSWQPATNNFTPNNRKSTFVPHGLTLRHTILGGTITNVTASAGTVTYTCKNNFTAGDIISIINVIPTAYNLTNVQVATASSTQFTVTNAATGTYVSGGNAFSYFQIPTGVTWVYALVVGGGASGGSGSAAGGKAGEVSWGWTTAQNNCIVGSGAISPDSPGNYSRYSSIIAVGGSSGTGAGVTNYWGIPGGASGGGIGSNAGSNSSGGNGGNGISGGGGGNSGGRGGSGLVGGGGGRFTTGTGGIGGNGIGIDGTIYTGGTTAGTGGGGGAGIAANGGNASSGGVGSGGLGGGGGGGGGGSGGNGIVYIWY